MIGMADAWNPAQYARFQNQRTQPYHDLRDLVRYRADMRVADLGCGAGALTADLHAHLHAKETVGYDSSERMLAEAKIHQAPGLRFVHKRIEEFATLQPFDLIFSNAALHWVGDHERLLSRLTAALSAEGQLAFQVPANDTHPSHRCALETARESEFAAALAGFTQPHNALDPAAYAELLYALGYREQHVRLQIYGHVLPSSAGVLEWVKGTLLTAYEARLSPALFARFVERYRTRLIDTVGDRRPYFFTYKRLLIWAQR